MTCEQFRDVMSTDRDVTPSELHAAGLHAQKCFACAKEVEKVVQNMTPEERILSRQEATKINRQVDDYLRHDPEAS